MKNVLPACRLFIFFVFISCTNANAKEKLKKQAAYKEYVVVSATNYETFQFSVQSNLTAYHFELVGGVCVYNGRFYQTMAK